LRKYVGVPNVIQVVLTTIIGKIISDYSTSKHQVNDFVEDVYYDEIRTVNDVNADLITKKDEQFWHQKVRLADKLVIFKIDIGAQTDVLPLSVVIILDLCKEVRSTNVRIIYYGGFVWTPIGCVIIESSIGSHCAKINYLVVNKESVPLICLTTAFMFGLTKRQGQSENFQIRMFKLTSKSIL